MIKKQKNRFIINNHSVLEVSQLNVSYEKNPVLWDITFDIPHGQLVGIIGPNGAGKSTLIKAALGLVVPVSGNISFSGKPLEEVRVDIAYVPQRESVDWDFPITVLELVLMGRYGRLGLFKRPSHQDKLDAEAYLEKVGMHHYKERQISQLSGGQQQRVFLARAMMQEAELYFLDEPFAGIDNATEKMMVAMLKDLCKNGKTVFVVHHDLNTIETYFDWIIMINMRLIAVGPTREVFTGENLNQTYGKSYTLLDQALKLSQQKTSGNYS